MILEKLFRRLFGAARYAPPIEVERAEHAFYIQFLRKGMVVFDVGAHVGEMTLLFSRFVGDEGRVHAFEASRGSYERLRSIVDLSGRKNIKVNHVAVSDKVGVARLHVYDDEHMSWNSLARRPLHLYGIDVSPVGTEEVPSTTIDAYCEREGISSIDLLKIDVEGAEYQVLRGARGMLDRKRVHCCVFEFGATTFDMGNDPEEMESYLAGCGYQIQNLVRGDPAFPGRSSAESARFSVHVARPRR